MTDYIDGNTDSGDVIDGGSFGTTPTDVIDGNILIFIGDPSEVSPSEETRELHIESLDGSLVIPLNVDVDRILKAGATGLGLPPRDVVRSTTPGMVGSWLQEINVLEREVFLPLEFASTTDQASLLANLEELRVLLWNTTADIGDLGAFMLVATTSGGNERVLRVEYESGWEGSWGGSDSGIDWEVFGLTLVAVDPYWRDRNPTTRTYQAAAGEVFVGDGSGANPWPRQISASVVIGSDMQIQVEGDIPVWPTVELDGPVSTAVVTYPGPNVNVPNGIPSNQSLILSTDPRARSARLNGAIAWSSIDIGSTFAPLQPGVNSVSIEVGTAGVGTGLLLSWTPGYLTPWG